jgi:hypothetical protein
MAQAADQHTAKEWSLEDYLRYVRLTLNCGINKALREMERRIVSDQLLLIRRRYDADGNRKGDPVLIERFNFLRNYTLQLDEDDRVRVVTRRPDTFFGPTLVSDKALVQRLTYWDRGRVTDGYYTVIERPPRPPASQTAPDQQPEDKTGPDPPKVWLPIEHKRRQQLNDIPKNITAYTRELHPAAVKAVRQGRLTYAPSARRLETLLHDLDLFPKIKRRTKDARKTHD